MNETTCRGSWLLLLAVVAACGDGSKARHDAGADAGPDAGPSFAPRALILDQELRHHAIWSDVIDALDAAGVAPRYRRFYPHLTAADVEPVAGEHPYEVVVLAAGRSPGNPASRLRLGEVALAREFVERGGVLVLAPQHGFEDSSAGRNDYFVVNRILEELAVPVRVEQGTLLGDLWNSVPAPPHETTDAGYPTPLETMFGYAYLLTPDDERLAGGAAPILRVADPGVEVLLRSHPAAYAWRRLEGAGSLELLGRHRAVAAVARAGEGYVAVVPRGPLTISATTGVLSDKPALDHAREAAGREWVAGLAQLLHGLASGAAELTVTAGVEEDELFSVGASNCPALDGSGEVVQLATSVVELELPVAPPAGDLFEAPASAPDDPRPLPAWFAGSAGKLAYGGLTPTDDQMAAAFDEIAAHGIDALMTSTTPSLLASLTGDALAAEQARYAAIATLAETAGVGWFVGDWINAEAGDYPPMTGAHGGTANCPAPLHQPFWDERVIPMYAAVGALAAEHPGLGGLHLDLELYSGPIWHHDGWAFSDDTVGVFLEQCDDAALGAELIAAAPGARLDLLVDRGALGDYFAALEQRAYELGCACREAARAAAPDLELTVYVPGFPDSWFYRGLLRGLGTAERPVTVLTYEGWGARPTARLYADGVSLAHLGGTIVGYYLPDDFADALVSLAGGNDGYWYFTFNDFSSTNPTPPELHGTPDEYWDAVDEANAQLE